MFFKSIKPLAEKGVNITVSTVNDKMLVIVLPTGKGSEKTTVPMVVTGTAEELDQQFAELVLRFTSSRTSMLDQVKMAEEAMKKQAEDAKSKLKKPAASKSTTVSDDGDDDEVDPDKISTEVFKKTPPASAAAPVAVSATDLF